MKITTAKGFQSTIDWYNKNARQYAEASIAAHNIHDKEQLARFVNLLPKEGKVLDAGCGSGRDTNLLSKKGPHVIVNGCRI